MLSVVDTLVIPITTYHYGHIHKLIVNAYQNSISTLIACIAGGAMLKNEQKMDGPSSESIARLVLK